jgi:hypothetical protein
VAGDPGNRARRADRGRLIRPSRRKALCQPVSAAGLIFDPRRLYVSAGSCVVAVAAERGRKLVKLGQGFLAPNAYIVAVDPATHLVHFPLESGSGGRPELRIMAPKTSA